MLKLLLLFLIGWGRGGAAGSGRWAGGGAGAWWRGVYGCWCGRKGRRRSSQQEQEQEQEQEQQEQEEKQEQEEEEEQQQQQEQEEQQEEERHWGRAAGRRCRAAAPVLARSRLFRLLRSLKLARALCPTSCHLRWVADRLGSARGGVGSGMLRQTSVKTVENGWRFRELRAQ